ncbi:CpaD family pilus assembly lipoprotein [Terasakiella sp. A23]|uniref:CpaD family pilus assembly lipoprotein n=1 Tax=Terasakiella sp. FCG-A23 TaxID=3080561 RepID=UPI002953214F|nr:CpaD family pilus assembly lipoprotein [Terasakiella sp. A23]MDV7340375.1 CpaD family pilus assembly lipoprotein [Terasakiella sp. A23]
MKTQIFTLGFCSLILMGCANVEDFSDVRSAREPIVTESQTSFDIVFDYGSSTLSKKDRRVIENFIMTHDLNRRDEIYVDVAENGGALAERRAEKIAAYLKRFGLKPAFKRATDQEALQTVRVTLHSYTVKVPNCPDWSDHPNQTYNNQVHSNFGCAQAANLALMIGNPRDLVKPHGLTHPDATVLSNAMTQYRLPREVSSEGSEEE